MMTMGLAENRAATEAFIAVAPVDIVLTPRVKTPDGTGGRQMALGTPRESQRFSLLEPSNSGYQEPLATRDGQQTTFDFMLLGKYDAIIAEDDVFTHEGKEYKLVTVMADNGYEKRALVLRHGW